MRDKELQICGTCKYHKYEPIDKGFVCTNADSDNCTYWTEFTDSCIDWEEKERGSKR